MKTNIQIKELECGNCGGQIQFTPESRLMVCNYCGSSFTPEHKQAHTVEGSPVDSIVPFRISREKYLREVNRWFTRGFLYRDDLLNNTSIVNTTGIYLPFYSYTVSYKADWKAESGYYRAREHKRFNWKRLRSEKKILHRIKWKKTSGHISGVIPHQKTMTLASVSVHEKYRSFCEKASLERIAQFSAEYLSGFACEPFTANSEEVFAARVKPNVDKLVQQRVDENIPGNFKRNVSFKITFERTTRALYLPFWKAGYQYKGKSFEILMHGDSGTVTGTKPLDRGRIILLLLLYTPLLAGFIFGNAFPYDAMKYRILIAGFLLPYWWSFGIGMMGVVLITVMLYVIRRKRVSSLLMRTLDI